MIQVRPGARFAAAILLTALALPGCGGRAPAENAAAAPLGPPPIHLTRVNEAAGIRFHHRAGASGRKYFPEVMGSGCAFADFTGDGRPDIYLLNCAPLPGTPPGPGYGNRFYRNNGDGTFTDTTRAAGLTDGGYCIGCCAGDYDNDGRPDLYVTHLGKNVLYHNEGNGRFADATRKAGVAAGGFSSGAAFADYDGDGFIDVYVSRYVKWDAAHNVPCYQMDRQRQVLGQCRPNVYAPERGILYHNDRNGAFSDVTAKAGLAVPPGRGLGAIWVDLEDSGRPDLFVANDMSANFLFINQGRGRFTEEALARGVALDETGHGQASMGVAAADYDGDGRLDLICTNFSGEYAALYRNTQNRFEDDSAGSGVAEATTPYVGFGVGLVDLNLDGWPDLFIGNGHVGQGAERFYPGASFAQPSICMVNDTHGRFLPVRDPGPAVTTPRVSRGVAFADFDGDGRPDVLVANWEGEPDLLRNDSPNPGHWLRLRLEGTHGNRSAIGARVVVTGGGRTQVQEVRSGASYCSQSELPLTFGLGPAAAADRITVRWPGGGTEAWETLATGTEHRLVEGQGRREAGARRQGGERPE